jgi:MOSC domain-containing protein YiiM
MEENVTQFVEFMSESAKLLPKESVQIKNTIKLSLTKVLETPREGLPCLNMRSRFKIEDILKCVQ